MLFAVSAAQLMAVMGVTFLFTALPQIAIDFESSLADVQWVVIVYTLILAATVPLWGRLSDLYQRKDLFLAGVILFVIGGVLGSQASNIQMLIGARAIMGLGGASMMANTLAIVTDVFPLSQRGLAFGLLAVMVSSGGALGPAAGGTVITQFGWDAAFLFLSGIGVVILVTGALFVPRSHTARLREPVDWIGAIVLGVALGSALLAITRGQTWGWDSPRILGLFAVGLVFAVVFFLAEGRSRFPLVNLSLFRNVPFATAQFAALFSLTAISTHDFILPFYWQAARGYSAQEAGLLMLPFPLGILIGAPLSGRLLRRWGPRLIGVAGLGIVVLALLMISQITVDMARPNIFWRLWIGGFGFGLFIAPNNNVVMSFVPAVARGSASGVLGMFRMIGAATGTAISGTVLGTVITNQYDGLPGSLVTKQDFARLQNDPQQLAQLNAAFEDGFSATFFVAMSFVLLALIFTAFGPARISEEADVEPEPEMMPMPAEPVRVTEAS